MSEAPEKKELTKEQQRMQQIQVEYNQICAQLGDAQFKLHLAGIELDKLEYNASKLKNKLASLNKEMGKLVAGESAEVTSIAPEASDEVDPTPAA